MTSVVRVGDNFTEGKKVNSLKQGCTLAPTLFNLTLVLWWHAGELGVLRLESQSSAGLEGNLLGIEQQYPGSKSLG